MKRCIIAMVGMVCLTAGSAGLAQPTFDLGFSGCGDLAGPPGANVDSFFDVTLTSVVDSDAGAQGWSISLSSSGVAITDITTQGTVAADVNDDPPGLRNTGFEKSETTASVGEARCAEGGDGAVSAVVLSFTMPITLPGNGTEAIARIGVAGTVGDESSDAAVFFIDGCRGSGQPVDNKVTLAGETITPSLGRCDFSVVVKPECPFDGNALQVIAQEASVGESTDLLAGMADTPSREEPAQIERVPGDSTVYFAIVSDGLASGVQGWSLSIAADESGGGALVDASTARTVGADVNDDPPGLRNTGFEKTELVDPALNGQGAGAVSAVVCSFTMPITLAPTGTATVIALGVSGADGDTLSLGARDGLQGAGQPVGNVATVAGGTVGFDCFQDMDISFVEPPVSDYIPGEVNADNRIDLADAIYLINATFRNGPEVACPAASDVNGDGQLGDVSDAIFLVEYLFLSGAAPSSLECGGAADLVDPTLCPSGTTTCP
ncbi:MAG: hypothetical protein AAF517_02105 [Planctomycetota bacterium]